jgi:hypothetical protein
MNDGKRDLLPPIVNIECRKFNYYILTDNVHKIHRVLTYWISGDQEVESKIFSVE